MDIITIVIIALLVVIAGLGILLYKTVTRNAEHTAPVEKPKENENTKSIQQ